MLVAILKVTDENSRIRSRIRIRKAVIDCDIEDCPTSVYILYILYNCVQCIHLGQIKRHNTLVYCF